MFRRFAPIALLLACQEYTIDKPATDPPVGDLDSDVGWGVCGFDLSPADVVEIDPCPPYTIGTFDPLVEWNGGHGKNATSLPVVADLDDDGMPEIIFNAVAGLNGKGELWAVGGDGSGPRWKNTTADLGYGAAPAVGDIDGDGDLEIVAVRALATQIGIQPYAAVAFDHTGTEIWQSAEYSTGDMDYATAPVLSDMDGDGAVEIVVGRVILNADGTERGKGTHGRGSYTGNGRTLIAFTEAGIPAVVDIDLDGVQEVIVGNAMYSPDGATLWHGSQRSDGMISVANLDDDPEGEFVACSGATIRAHDTDGTLLWGPLELDGANIVSPAAISDLDNDGYPEIVTAGGNEVVAFNHDGTRLWEREVRDETGATGASIFDFDGDGVEEVVYIDEIRMYAFNGTDGATKFQSDEHNSPTMMDYPVIADVDADGQAEIIVAHSGYRPNGGLTTAAFTVYGAGDGRWAPTRSVWNQHAYAINGIEDDGTMPTSRLEGFQSHNSWHAATDRGLYEVSSLPELQSSIIGICETECDRGVVYVAVHPINRTSGEVEPGMPVTLYGFGGGESFVLGTQLTTEVIEGASSGEAMIFEVTVEDAQRAETFAVVVDDDGTGDPTDQASAGTTGLVDECSERDNVFTVSGPFCEGI